jgi:NAD-dependent deacetylase sirtuin 4
LLKHALTMRKPVLLLNIGPTRADGLAAVEKIDMASGAIIQDIVKNVVYVLPHLYGIMR